MRYNISDGIGLVIGLNGLGVLFLCSALYFYKVKHCIINAAKIFNVMRYYLIRIAYLIYSKFTLFNMHIAKCMYIAFISICLQFKSIFTKSVV